MRFLAGLFGLSACTLMYQVILTRLLSVTAWYYLAFVAISMSLFGLTAGALVVQLRPDLFPDERVRERTAQVTRLMGLSMPPTLIGMLAVPLEIAYSLQTLFSFILFSAIISVPLVLGGIGVCLALTRSDVPFGRAYAVDLVGAATGCFAALALLNVLDGPSAFLVVSALVLVSAAFFSRSAGEPWQRHLKIAAVVAAAAGLNSLTPYGIQPIWAKGEIDRRDSILAEIWNPISRVKVYQPTVGPPALWGASPIAPPARVEKILLDIDNDAGTWITRFGGDVSQLGYLRYDVASLPAELRSGGRAAIIGAGGGRDVLAAAHFGFSRIVAIEVNPAIVAVTTDRLKEFSGLAALPGVEYHVDEARSFLSRSHDEFDLIQATLVDTWAGTAAGAMALTENSLYTVEAWRTFHQRLSPNGVLAFSRWSWAGEAYQMRRLFSLAWSVLELEGAARPADHLAFLSCSGVATLMLSPSPFSADDVDRLRRIAEERRFEILHLPGQQPSDPVLQRIASADSVDDLLRLRAGGQVDYSPPFDDSPFFFNALRLSHFLDAVSKGDVALLIGGGTIRGGNLRALSFFLLFLTAASVLVFVTIVWPLRRRLNQPLGPASAGAAAYFIAIGLAFMLVEMGMMHQLGLFLGHPIYALVVVLAGLIFFTGLGSLLSERMKLGSRSAFRVPALLAAAAVGSYVWLLPRVTEMLATAALSQRVLASMALVGVPGLVMGLCMPAGIRAMRAAGQAQLLPWAWALNGSASVLGTFVAIFAAMEHGLTACVLAGSASYLIAAAVIRPDPWT